MITPWGDLEVCDAHVHFFSHRFFSMLAAQKGMEVAEAVAALGWRMPPADPAGLGAEWVAELDRRGVRRAVLIASLPGDEESVAAAADRYPQRFYGYFMVNPLAADAVERVARGLGELGLRGICLFPAMHRYSIAGESIRPVLDLAAKHRAVVFVHCGVLTVGVRKKLGLPSPFDMRYSNPIDLHPVALAYPDVRFVAPHFGAGYFREALMLCDLCPNVFLDTSSTNAWIRYHAPPIALRDVFARALDVAGAGRLLFGTDSSFFPRGWNAAILPPQIEAMEALGLGASEATAILGGNLDRLMQLA